MPTLSPKTTRHAIMLSLVLLASSLAACGVKPSEVEPPPGEASQHFPHTYPAPDGR